MSVELWGVVDPDGELMDIAPSSSESAALYAASRCSRGDKRGTDYATGDDLHARCYRAQGNSFDWVAPLATEIASLMGYKAVRVKIVRVDEDVA